MNKSLKPVKKTKRVMKFRQELFWDVDPKTINPKKHARYIIERVLDFGELNEVKWIAHYYRTDTIRKVLALPRVQIHKKSKLLWERVFQKKV